MEDFNIEISMAGSHASWLVDLDDLGRFKISKEQKSYGSLIFRLYHVMTISLNQ